MKEVTEWNGKPLCNVWKGADYLFFKNLCKINEITDDEILRATS